MNAEDVIEVPNEQIRQKPMLVPTIVFLFFFSIATIYSIFISIWLD